MTAQELVALSQKLNELCQRAELELSEAGNHSLVEELKLRLRSIQDATDFEPR